MYITVKHYINGRYLYREVIDTRKDSYIIYILSNQATTGAWEMVIQVWNDGNPSKYTEW